MTRSFEEMMMKGKIVKSLVGVALVAVLLGRGFVGGALAEEKIYRHVVLFKFAESASAEKIAEIEKAFGALPAKINSIVGYEWGTNVSPEGLDKGFTHCFLVSFKDKAGLEVYLPHPAHQEFISLLKPHLEEALVIDFQGSD